MQTTKNFSYNFQNNQINLKIYNDLFDNEEIAFASLKLLLFFPNHWFIHMMYISINKLRISLKKYKTARYAMKACKTMAFFCKDMVSQDNV